MNQSLLLCNVHVVTHATSPAWLTFPLSVQSFSALLSFVISIDQSLHSPLLTSLLSGHFSSSVRSWWKEYAGLPMVGFTLVCVLNCTFYVFALDTEFLWMLSESFLIFNLILFLMICECIHIYVSIECVSA